MTQTKEEPVFQFIVKRTEADRDGATRTEKTVESIANSRLSKCWQMTDMFVIRDYEAVMFVFVNTVESS